MRILLMIFSLLLLNCKSVNNNENKTTEYKSQEGKIIGSWKICAVKGNGRVVHSNICKTILFNENGKGTLSMEDEIICSFKWKVDSNSIIFITDSLNDQTKFLSGDSEYSIKLYDKSDLHYLEINPKGKDIFYFLTRP